MKKNPKSAQDTIVIIKRKRILKVHFHISIFTYFPHCTLYIFHYTDKGFLLDNQELVKLVIIC